MLDREKEIITAELAPRLVSDSFAVDGSETEIQCKLIGQILDDGASLENLDNLNLETLDVCATLFISKGPKFFLQLVLRQYLYDYDNKKLEIIEKLVRQVLDISPNLNVLLLESITPLDMYDWHKDFFLDFVHPTDILLRVVYFMVEGGYDCPSKIVNHLIASGADTNVIYDDHDAVLDILVTRRCFGSALAAISYNSKAVLGFSGCVGAINTLNISYIAEVLSLFQSYCSHQGMYELLRARGVSNAVAYGLLNIYDLTQDYLATARSPGSFAKLTPIEMALLNNSAPLFPLDLYLDQNNIRNSYGFTALTIAILARRLDLAIQMVGIADFSVVSNVGLSALVLLARLQSLANDRYNIFDDPELDALNYLTNIITDRTNDVDVTIGLGESIVDEFLGIYSLRDRVLQKSHDAIYRLIKNSKDLNVLSCNRGQANIAITSDEHFWSTGVISWARLAMQNHPNVQFFLVTPEVLEAGGDELVSLFDGWINPGASDSYPKKQIFSKEDCPLSLSIESMYQRVLGLSHTHQIPYLGMCAGAQHLVLHHRGYLYPLTGYSGGKHSINHIPRTLAHFLAMTADHQKIALQHCAFPEISFKADTAHHYAGVRGNLGIGMELGAVSEDMVPMTYAHSSGLMYATQFHPEHDYIKAQNPNYAATWLDNFIRITELHHAARVDGAEHPIQLFAEISARLYECNAKPTCLGDNLSLPLLYIH